MKSTNRLTKYLNIYISLLLCNQPNRNMLILTKDNNALDYSIHHKREKYLLGNEGLNNVEDQKDLLGESFDNENIRKRLPRSIH